MANDNIVVFKGRKDGIIVVLNETADFDDIKAALRLKMTDAQDFFGDAKTQISFDGRILEENEERELLEIIRDGSSLDINFAASEDDTNSMENIFTKDTEKEKPDAEPVPVAYAADTMTKFHNGSLRSGQAIQYAGSVVLIGDVNPGAEIVAEGNIIVMGTIKGLVHAGCAGNTGCYVSALNMQPTQLRISDVITYMPPELVKENKKKINPVYAYVQDGQIYIEPLG